MIHEHAPTAAIADADRRTQRTAEARVVRQRYRHIVVPTTLDPADRAALLQALELAAVHGATVAVLYIRPEEETGDSFDWLDAIDRLHQGLDHGGNGPLGDAATDFESCGMRIKQFLTQELPASLMEQVEIRTDWRSGDPGDVIVRYADEAAADLIVLSSGPARWWLPSLPGAVRRVLQQSKREVLIVRPDARPTRCDE